MNLKKYLQKHVIQYAINNNRGNYGLVFCRQFLWFPGRCNDGWHWLVWSWVLHEEVGSDWISYRMSNDEFLVYKLSNTLVKVE